MVYVDHFPDNKVEIYKKYDNGTTILALYNNKTIITGPEDKEIIQADVLYLIQPVENIDEVINNFDTYWNNLLLEEQKKLITKYTNRIQNFLDTTARQRGYDSIFTLCSYLGSTNEKFAKEAKAAVAWRDAVWIKCYQIEADVQAGKIEAPTEEELINEMPKIDW